MYFEIADTEVIRRELYYPFGMPLDNYWSKPAPALTPTQDFLYNGKEYETAGDLNWYFYGARWYDPAVGRFTGVDPIAAQFAHVSGYNYAENMPVSHVDLYGLQAFIPELTQAVSSGVRSLYENVSRLNDNAHRQGLIIEQTSGSRLNALQSSAVYFSVYADEIGNYTSQNDIAVLMYGENMDGTSATAGDRALALVFIALPGSGGAVKGALTKGLVKVFKNGEEVLETAYKFGNLGHRGTAPYREATEALKSGGNYVAKSTEEALQLLNDAFPNIPNQTGSRQGRFGYRIDQGMTGEGLKNGHDGLHINYYDKDSDTKGAIFIGE